MRAISAGALVAAATLLLPGILPAHPGRSLEPGDVWGAWTWDPWVLFAVGAWAFLYARGVGRVWGRAGRGRGVREWQFCTFCGGLIVLLVALVSPIHAVGGALFWVHMLQHEILILVAAPLLASSAPHVAAAWGFPKQWVRTGRRVLRWKPIQSAWRMASHPIGAWVIHAAALWGWHTPALYQATLSSESAHFAQHFSFFGTALLFWWVVIHPRCHPAGYGAGILMLFTTALHSNALGALLTFSSQPWYPLYGETVERWGLTLLEDQQLGGLIMWVPAGMIYAGAALVLLARWLTPPTVGRRSAARRGSAGELNAIPR